MNVNSGRNTFNSVKDLDGPTPGVGNYSQGDVLSYSIIAETGDVAGPCHGFDTVAGLGAIGEDPIFNGQPLIRFLVWDEETTNDDSVRIGITDTPILTGMLVVDGAQSIPLSYDPATNELIGRDNNNELADILEATVGAGGSFTFKIVVYSTDTAKMEA